MLWSKSRSSLNRQVLGYVAMLMCCRYARLKFPASGKEQPHKSDANGSPATRNAAGLAQVFSSLRLEGFGCGSRDLQVLRIPGGGRFTHFTKPFACGKKVQSALNTTDLAGRFKTITPGARAN